MLHWLPGFRASFSASSFRFVGEVTLCTGRGPAMPSAFMLFILWYGVTGVVVNAHGLQFLLADVCVAHIYLWGAFPALALRTRDLKRFLGILHRSF